MTGDGFNPWLLDDADIPRQRYTKSDVKRGQTELLQCRADAFHVRRIDEIVASRLEANFKTRSDVVQDAVAMWLEDWDRRYPDGASGELSYQGRLEKLQRRQQHRDSFMETASEYMDSLRTTGDIYGLKEFLQVLLMAQGDFRADAPVSYMNKLEYMVETAERLLNDAR